MEQLRSLSLFVSLLISPLRGEDLGSPSGTPGAEDYFPAFRDLLEGRIVNLDVRRPGPFFVCHFFHPQPCDRDIATTAATRLSPSKLKPALTIFRRCDIHASRLAMSPMY